MWCIRWLSETNKSSNPDTKICSIQATFNAAFGFALAAAPVNSRAAMKWVCALGLSFWCFGALGADDVEYDRRAVFGGIEENDLVVKTDRHYTQGIKLFYLHSDNYLPWRTSALTNVVRQFGFTTTNVKFGYDIGQNIYTPAHTRKPSLQVDDRPYAGWLYVGLILQRRGVSFGDKLTQEEFGLDLGVIGSWSLAKEAQVWVHETRDIPLPKGWKNQLENEPGVQLKYSRAVRLLPRGGEEFSFDATPHLGLSLGNVETSARLGGTVRVGWNLPDDFTFRTIDALGTPAGARFGGRSHHWSIYGFASVEGRAVAFNESLDGNMWHDSRSVQREWFVGNATVGFTVVFKLLEVGYTQTFRTPEFRGQTEHDSFGSIYGTWRF
jgi:lipid A 3-O-deacylase